MGGFPVYTVRYGTPERIREEVKKHLEIMAPGVDISSQPDILWRTVPRRIWRLSWNLLTCTENTKNAHSR